MLRSVEKGSSIEAIKQAAGLEQGIGGYEAQQKSANITAAATMAEAGHSLEGGEAEIIINPIRLAIETKQSKLIEPALDCLHVKFLSISF